MDAFDNSICFRERIDKNWLGFTMLPNFSDFLELWRRVGRVLQKHFLSGLFAWAYIYIYFFFYACFFNERCVNKHTLERKAVKIIMKEDMKAEEKDLLRAEIAIMKLVNHPNIIRMEAVYESKKASHLRGGRKGRDDMATFNEIQCVW